MLSLCPMMTPGTPGRVTPSTFKPGAVSWTIHHVEGNPNSRCGSFASNGLPDAGCDAAITPAVHAGEGNPNARCGSFASNGLPDAVCDPAIAQAFEPGEISAPVRGG